MPNSDFCRECGAAFPPRFGEGHCINWNRCEEAQRLREALKEIAHPIFRRRKDMIEIARKALTPDKRR